MSRTAKTPAKTGEVFEYVKRCATEMRTVTYKEIACAVGLAKPGVAYPLGYIRDEICRKQGLPWLTVIVVNADTRRPGEKFLPNEVEFGQDNELLWRGMVLQVFSYPWERVSFPEEAS